MEIKLVKAGPDDAEILWRMQIRAFQGLYEKYQDTATSPAAETADRMAARLEQPSTYYYFIEVDGVMVGAVRVVDKKEEGKAKRVSPIFILEEHRNQGYAQKALKMAEAIHGNSNWELDTILQEKANCHLYEKMGYRQTGKPKRVNDKLTLVFYKKA